MRTLRDYSLPLDVYHPVHGLAWNQIRHGSSFLKKILSPPSPLHPSSSLFHIFRDAFSVLSRHSRPDWMFQGPECSKCSEKVVHKDASSYQDIPLVSFFLLQGLYESDVQKVIKRFRVQLSKRFTWKRSREKLKCTQLCCKAICLNCT